MVVAALFNAGDQLPATPLLDITGSAARVAPAQIGETCVKVGVTLGFTVIVIVVVAAQTPGIANGVKV